MKRSLLTLLAAGVFLFSVSGTVNAGWMNGASSYSFGPPMNIGYTEFGHYGGGFSSHYRNLSYAPQSYNSRGFNSMPSYSAPVQHHHSFNNNYYGGYGHNAIRRRYR